MRITRRFSLAACSALMSLSGIAHAASIVGGGAYPPNVTLPSGVNSTLVKFAFQVKYFNQEKFACGAAIDYGDGRPPEKISIQAPTESVTRDYRTGGPGTFKVTLTGTAHSGLVACLGSSTAIATVTKPAEIAPGTTPLGIGGGQQPGPTAKDAPGLNLGTPPGAVQKNAPGLTLTAPADTLPQPLKPGMAGTGAPAASQAIFLGTPVDIALTIDAGVFPYGVRQGFKLTSDTKGNTCHFTVEVTSIGATDYTLSVDKPLPWASDDLKLPYKLGGYTLRVNARSGANACKGTISRYFDVVPQTGVISGISPPVQSIAVGQALNANILGKTYGFCRYSVAVKAADGTAAFGPLDIYEMPYRLDTQMNKAGTFHITADQLNDAASGLPLGCTGHVTSQTFTVLARPACPSPQYAYQSPDDSDYGCLYPPSVQSTITETFACPTGYGPIASTTFPNVRYGCHKQAAPPFYITPGTFKAFATAAAAASAPPSPDAPRIVRAQVVAASGGAPRPNKNVLYAGEELKINVVGNVQNSAGFNPNQCTYTIAVENLSTHKRMTATFSQFGVQSMKSDYAAGDYNVKVTPNYSDGGGCLGQAEIPKITLYTPAAWITGLKLTGYGYHWSAGDNMGYPQFCETCGSIFSPAHNSAFLRTEPKIESGPKCTYTITHNGKTKLALYSGSAIPDGQADYEPYMTKWDDDKNTVTVTVKGVSGYPVPACNGSFTKTITFTDNPNAPAVVVQ